MAATKPRSKPPGYNQNTTVNNFLESFEPNHILNNPHHAQVKILPGAPYRQQALAVGKP